MTLDRDTILLVEDDDSFRRALAEVLRANGYDVVVAADAEEALETLQDRSVDAVVTDLVMPGMKGHELLERICSTFPSLPTVAITAFGSVEEAVRITRAGAADYLTKPFATRALLDSLARVLHDSRPRRAHARARREISHHFERLVGSSRPMLRLFERIARVAPSPASVLITGESGTGKELVARTIHDISGRNAFIPVNCGALPEALLESELFGHARGAFTGAEREKTGLFEAADGGTLFLDEVAELPLSLQPKLLRALEAGEIRRLGEVQPREAQVRIIAATHRELRPLVEAGEFREDLFWRLNVLHIEVPPLRDRAADIPLLVENHLQAHAHRTGRSAPVVTPEALALLLAHPWPGNVRQLFNALEQAVTFADEPILRPEHLPADVRAEGDRAARPATAADRNLTLQELEREYILEILRRTGGNKTRAADLLGIPRRTLYRRLDAYESGDT